MASTRSEKTAALLSRSRAGVVGRRDLLQSGLSRELIRSRIEGGWLLRACRGVYAVGRAADGEDGVRSAALFAAGPDSVLAGRTAAAFWGFLDWKGTVDMVRKETRRPPLVHLGPPGLTRGRTIEVRRSSLLSDRDTLTVRGYRVMSVSRTLLDLAGLLSERRLRTAFDEADRLGLLEGSDLSDLLTRTGRGVSGVARLRRLMHLRQPELASTESELEGLFLSLLSKAGLQLPTPNQELLDYRVDCLWRSRSLVVELDGYAFHRGRMATERDVWRDNRLRMAGYRVIRFTYDMVVNHGDDVIALVSRELGTSGPILVGGRHSGAT